VADMPISLSAILIPLMLTYLLGEVLRINNGDSAVGKYEMWSLPTACGWESPPGMTETGANLEGNFNDE
jgi:hypothetical protein